MRFFPQLFSLAAAFVLVVSACSSDPADPVIEPAPALTAELTPTSTPVDETLEPVVEPTADVGVTPDPEPTVEATAAPTVEPTPVPIPTSTVNQTPAPVICGPVLVHGEPHAREPIDTDGDGYEDACRYADHLEHDDVESFVCEDGTQVEAEPSSECQAAVVVPYLIGETVAAAVARLEALGLGWTVDLPTPGDSKVLDQRPQVGAEVLSGSVVALITSIPIVIPTVAPEVTATPTAIPVPTVAPTAAPTSTTEPEDDESGGISDEARRALGCPPYGDMVCAVGSDGLPFAMQEPLPANTEFVGDGWSESEWDVDALTAIFHAVLRESFDAKVAVARAEVLAEAGVEPGTKEAAEIITAQGAEIARRATLAAIAEAEQRCDCRR